MTKVYIVTATTGEYSDRDERNVAVFYSEAEAREFVRSLYLVYKTFQQNDCGSQRGDDEMERLKKALKPYDPHFREDYTGADWYINGPWPLK